jgi:amino acid transporter
MQQKTKKITFLSIVLFTVGSTIGSGIFIKNSTILKYNQGELLGTSLSWILALVAFFALALTLVEVCQGAKEENANGIPG